MYLFTPRLLEESLLINTVLANKGSQQDAINIKSIRLKEFTASLVEMRSEFVEQIDVGKEPGANVRKT